MCVCVCVCTCTCVCLCVQVEEKPDVTYNDVGGCKEQIEKLKEVVEMPLLHVSHVISLKPHPLIISYVSVA